MEAALVGKLGINVVILRYLQSIFISHGNQSSFLSVNGVVSISFSAWSGNRGERRVMPLCTP
jgi:hypothetical protein